MSVWQIVITLIGVILFVALAITVLIGIIAGIVAIQGGIVRICTTIALKPLYILTDYILIPIAKLKEGIIRLYCRITKKDYDDMIEDEECEEQSFGIYNVIFALFCVAFSVVVIIWVISSGKVEANFVEGDFLEALPIYAILNMAYNGAISFEGLIQLALFNIIAFFLMRRNHFGFDSVGKSILTLVFELIFTVFTTALIYIIPDSVYSAPGDFMYTMEELLLVGDGNGFLAVLGTVAYGIIWMIMAYIMIVLYALTFREIVASAVYSFVPLICVFLFLMFIPTGESADPLITNVICYIITIIATMIVSYLRVENDNEILEEIEEAKEERRYKWEDKRLLRRASRERKKAEKARKEYLKQKEKELEEFRQRLRNNTGNNKS